MSVWTDHKEVVRINVKVCIPCCQCHASWHLGHSPYVFKVGSLMRWFRCT